MAGSNAPPSSSHAFGRRRGFDRFTFEIVPDGQTRAQNGKPINFSAGGFTPDPKPGLAEVANLAHYRGGLGYIAFWKDDWSTVEGSAAIVGPGAALTAFHVLEELLPQIVEGELHLMLLAPTAAGGLAWRIRNITRVGDTDLAILSLALASKMPRNRKLNYLALCAVPPAKGETVMISGYRAASDVVPAKEEVYFPADPITHGMRLHRAVGSVVSPIDERQMVQVDAHCVGGMSGGPAFNSRGLCFGVLSSSIDHGGGAGTSRIQPIWPAAATAFPDQFLRMRETAFFELEGLSISRREMVQVDQIFPGINRVAVKESIET